MVYVNMYYFQKRILSTGFSRCQNLFDFVDVFQSKVFTEGILDFSLFFLHNSENTMKVCLCHILPLPYLYPID